MTKVTIAGGVVVVACGIGVFMNVTRPAHVSRAAPSQMPAGSKVLAQSESVGAPHGREAASQVGLEEASETGPRGGQPHETWPRKMWPTRLVPILTINSRSASVVRKRVGKYETRAVIAVEEPGALNVQSNAGVGGFGASLAARSQLALSSRFAELRLAAKEQLFAAVDALLANRSDVPAWLLLPEPVESLREQVGEPPAAAWLLLYSVVMGEGSGGKGDDARPRCVIDYIGRLRASERGAVAIARVQRASAGRSFSFESVAGLNGAAAPAPSPDVTASLATWLAEVEQTAQARERDEGRDVTRVRSESTGGSSPRAMVVALGAAGPGRGNRDEYYYVEVPGPRMNVTGSTFGSGAGVSVAERGVAGSAAGAVRVVALGDSLPVVLAWTGGKPPPAQDYGDYLLAAAGQQPGSLPGRGSIARIDDSAAPAYLKAAIKEAIARYHRSVDCELDLRLTAEGGANEYYVTLRFQPSAVGAAVPMTDVVVSSWERAPDAAAGDRVGGRVHLDYAPTPITQAMLEARWGFVFGAEPSSEGQTWRGGEEYKPWLATEFAVVQGLMQQLAPRHVLALRGVRWVRMSRPPGHRAASEIGRRAGYTIARGDDITIYLYDDAYAGSSEFRIVSERATAPWVAMTIAHELAHALEARTGVVKVFNERFPRCQACTTWYAESKPATEMFPEAFALFLLDATWLEENYGEVYRWLRVWNEP